VKIKKATLRILLFVVIVSGVALCALSSYADSKTCKLKMPGLQSRVTASQAHEAVMAIDGVTGAEVDMVEQSIQVTYDNTEVSTDKIKDELSKGCRYRVTEI